MRELENHSTATGFRDILRKFIRAEVERIRPRYRYATVVDPVKVNNKVKVRFPGEVGTVMVNAPGASPILVNQIVRVEGLHGDRYIAEVSGASSRNVLFAYDFMIVP